MKLKTPVLALLFLTLLGTALHAQLYQVSLDEKVSQSNLIVEGRVISKTSFWNSAHTMIFTNNTIKVYKVFKGTLAATKIEVMTLGGNVGPDFVDVSEVLSLRQSQVGLFFCNPNSIALKSPVTNNTLYDIYGSDQGFLRYDLRNNKATAPFAVYQDIEKSLYPAIEQKTGRGYSVVDKSFSVGASVQSVRKPGSLSGVITSFSPQTVTAGTINDPTNNVLTINGTGFGATPSGFCAVNFKDGNNSNTTPDYSVAYNSPYVISWSDTKIQVRVPSRAATGVFGVTLSDSTLVTSTTNLTVSYAVLAYEFNFSGANPPVNKTVVSEIRLMNDNGLGGYTYRFSTSTAGGALNFATAPAAATFGRALQTWIDRVGINFFQGNTTTTQAIADDKINLIEFDNSNTTVPLMAAGVLEETFSYGSLCYNASPFSYTMGVKTGFDILVRNPGVSVGTIPIADGPCFPAASGSTYETDRESIVLHEIGHALNLAHINDDIEAQNLNSLTTTTVNPEKVMHYAIINYVDRRSLDNSCYQGGLYTTKPQGNTYGSCGLATTEMSRLSTVSVTNDDCPNAFPTAATIKGTAVNIDLIHATSNKYSDPQFNLVNCGSATEDEFVTNTAYYAFKSGPTANGSLNITISNYTTSPTSLATCSGQGVKLDVFDVSSCPGGQNYPTAFTCRTLLGNGTVTAINGLLANHSYLLYFDGLRNTKASFTMTLNGTALPIILSSFTGDYLNGMDNLYIGITHAFNVKEIDVQKSADGTDFTYLGMLPSIAALGGNFTYTDEHPFSGNNFYRLKIIDADGSVEYSRVLLLTNTKARLVYIYPNPVTSNLYINITGGTPGTDHLNVYDMLGQLVMSTDVSITAPNQTIQLPFSPSAKGTYLVKLVDAGGAILAHQMIMKK